MKNILFSLIAIAFFVGCSKEDDLQEKITLDKNSLSLLYNEQSTLSATGFTSNDYIWSSSNEFVASVYNGRVTGNHVGEATIYVSYKNVKDSCKIVVNSVNNCIKEPNIKWGISMQNLKSKEKNTLVYESYNSNFDITLLTYKVDTYDYYVYFFKNNSLILSEQKINIATSIIDMTNSLYERYQYLSFSLSKYWYNKNGCIVMMEKQTQGGYYVYFSSNSDTVKSYCNVSIW